jgi:anthranilate phosphoribosyltransferase
VSIKTAIAALCEGQDLSDAIIGSAFGEIMGGVASPAQIGALLAGLAQKGETAEEIAGAAAVMRAHATGFDAHEYTAIDTCGTGGDGSSSLNVSTMAAVVAAAAGAKVIKHGNRALSSKSGSADVLEALGVRIECTRDTAKRCLDELGITFLIAPAYHAATRHAAGPRRELGVRTIFNLLGPLTNPAKLRHQVVGVFDGKWCGPLAIALGRLGAKKAMVVHGHGGVDEIAVDGPTQVSTWSGDQAEETTISPASFGLALSNVAELAGDDAAFNALAFKRVLEGAEGAPRQATLMSAGAALYTVGIASTLPLGAEQAAKAIDSGKAKALLSEWARMSSQ